MTRERNFFLFLLPVPRFNKILERKKIKCLSLLTKAHSVSICVKTNKCNNYLFNLLIMYGSFCMFRHNIAIFRERS
jgi:hypothetical protein